MVFGHVTKQTCQHAQWMLHINSCHVYKGISLVVTQVLLNQFVSAAMTKFCENTCKCLGSGFKTQKFLNIAMATILEI